MRGKRSQMRVYAQIQRRTRFLEDELPLWVERFAALKGRTAAIRSPGGAEPTNGAVRWWERVYDAGVTDDLAWNALWSYPRHTTLDYGRGFPPDDYEREKVSVALLSAYVALLREYHGYTYAGHKAVQTGSGVVYVPHGSDYETPGTAKVLEDPEIEEYARHLQLCTPLLAPTTAISYLKERGVAILWNLKRGVLRVTRSDGVVPVLPDSIAQNYLERAKALMSAVAAPTLIPSARPYRVGIGERELGEGALGRRTPYLSGERCLPIPGAELYVAGDVRLQGQAQGRIHATVVMMSHAMRLRDWCLREKLDPMLDG